MNQSLDWTSRGTFEFHETSNASCSLELTSCDNILNVFTDASRWHTHTDPDPLQITQKVQVHVSVSADVILRIRKGFFVGRVLGDLCSEAVLQNHATSWKFWALKGLRLRLCFAIGTSPIFLCSCAFPVSRVSAHIRSRRLWRAYSNGRWKAHFLWRKIRLRSFVRYDKQHQLCSRVISGC